jgi:HAD domain in Swiss Army Knife RNA repair proteins
MVFCCLNDYGLFSVCASAGPASASATSNDFLRAEIAATSAQHLPETERQAVLGNVREIAVKSTISSRASVKVLFLDIDGVVNNERTKKTSGNFMAIDPALAALVKRIVRNTGCEVVLSSSWRLFQHSRDEVERKICKFADITPVLHAPRGYEIKVWLMLHSEIKHYAILDDAESILPEQRANFFRTTWESGLTEDIALAVEKHLIDSSCDVTAARLPFPPKRVIPGNHGSP